MLQIGPYQLANTVVLAPMAGVTDLPFRRLCRAMGAGLVVAEMVTSDTRLWDTAKSRRRLDHRGEAEPVTVQIAGSEPHMLAEAARSAVDRGAQIIDINMGCPAKKVCNRAAGSALLRDEQLVARILESVVSAVNVPVTLKIRTGWSPEERNGVEIASIAEQSGIQSLAVHGRTRACRFKGHAEYATIAAIKAEIKIPVIANGDIASVEDAAQVLELTGADGIMIGRAAQGRPWLCGQIADYLATGLRTAAPDRSQLLSIMSTHLADIHEFYGEYTGVRIARKHLGWYLEDAGDRQFRVRFNQLECPQQQLNALQTYFSRAPDTATIEQRGIAA